MNKMIDSGFLKTMSAALVGIGSSSWTTIKGFLADATVRPPSGYDMFIARAIAACALIYGVIRIWKALKSKKDTE